jgi:hypothetical protein
MGAHTLQGGVQGRQMDRFRHKPCGLGGGLEVLEGHRIRVGAHVDDRDRRGGLNVPRRLNVVHSSLQMDVHEHYVRMASAGVFNHLRATVG